MKILACWIVKDEAEELGRSMQNVQAGVDGMLVVSTAGNEAVKEVAESFGATLLSYAWQDDFSAARNYALEAMDTDLVLFLDADEYFEEALGKRQREKLEKEFAMGGLGALAFERKNYDSVTGAYIQTSVDIRLFRASLRYKGAIHERLATPEGGPPQWQVFDGLKIIHTGYGVQASREKFLRNYRILVAAVKKGGDRVETAIHLCYLLRECHNLGKFDEAAGYLRRFAENEQDVEVIFNRYIDIGRQAVFYALLVAEKAGDEELGSMVRNRLVPAFALTADRESVELLKLSCRQKLCPNDGELLRELGRLPTFHPDPDKDVFFSLLVDLYSAAGAAALRRGDGPLAFTCAHKAFTMHESVKNEADFDTCLLALGQEGIETKIAAVCQGLDLDSKGLLELLVEYAQLAGYEKMYLFFTLTAFEKKLLSSIDYCFFLIYSKKYREAAAYALKSIGNEQYRQCMLLLAAVCGGDAALLAENRVYMGEYAGPAEAFLQGRSLSAEDCGRIGIPGYCYRKIAFAVGLEQANRFLAMYEQAGDEKVRLLCFDIRRGYYAKCGLYQDFFRVNPYMPVVGDTQSGLALAEMALLAKDWPRVLAVLQGLADEEEHCRTVNLLEAVEALAPPEPAAQAGALAAQLRTGIRWDE